MSRLTKKSPLFRGDFLKTSGVLKLDFFVVFCFPSDGRLVVFKDWIDPGFLRIGLGLVLVFWIVGFQFGFSIGYCDADDVKMQRQTVPDKNKQGWFPELRGNMEGV